MRNPAQIGDVVNGFKIFDKRRENKRTYLYIQCPVCSGHKWMRADTVKNQKVCSCGCYNAENNYVKPVDCTGERFGRLVALEATQNRDSYNGSIIWRCQCDCGKEVHVSIRHLKKGEVRSCGCLKKEILTKNGENAGEYVVQNHVIDGTNIKNLQSNKLSIRNKSGVTGVCWISTRKIWIAQIRFKGKIID